MRVPCQNRWVLAAGRRNRADLSASKTNRRKQLWHSEEHGSKTTKKLIFPDLKGKNISLLSDLPQEVFLHRGLRCVVPCGRVHLDALDPDVSPEGQAHHVQVITSVAEGAGEVDVHCKEGDIFRVPAVTGFKIVSDSGTFPAVEAGRVHFDGALCTQEEKQWHQFRHGCLSLRVWTLQDIPTTSTESTWSTKSLFPKYRVICGAEANSKGYFWRRSKCSPS